MALPKRKPEWNPPSPNKVPSRWKFPANDPIYREAKKLFKLYPWLKALYNIYDLYNLIKSYNDAPQLYSVKDTNGWSLWKECSHGAPSIGLMLTGIDNWNTICTLPAQAGGFNPANWYPGRPIPANIRQLNLAVHPWLGQIDRAKYTQIWQRPAGSYQVKPLIFPRKFTIPYEALTLIPELYPNTAPVPVRMPYKLLPHIKSPFIERSYHEYPKQNQKPSNQPRNIANYETVITSTPAGRLAVSLRPSRHSSKPPTSGIRENKQRSNSATTALTIASAVTETNDFIKSIWEALPYQYREYGYSGLMQDKIRDIYNHSSHIDFNKAIKNIAENQIEDFSYGYLPSKYLAPINQQVYSGDKYRSRGILTGHSQRQSYIY